MELELKARVKVKWCQFEELIGFRPTQWQYLSNAIIERYGIEAFEVLTIDQILIELENPRSLPIPKPNSKSSVSSNRHTASPVKERKSTH